MAQAADPSKKMPVRRAPAGGMPYDEVVCLCGTKFWGKLLTNEKFRQSRNAWQATTQRTAYWDQFGEITQLVWSGIRFIKYPAYSFGNGMQFPVDKAYVFPIGIQGKFETQYAVSDFNDRRAGDVGLKYYAKLEPGEFDRGMKIYLQSNALTYDAFPETTLEVSVAP